MNKKEFITNLIDVFDEFDCNNGDCCPEDFGLNEYGCEEPNSNCSKCFAHSIFNTMMEVTE